LSGRNLDTPFVTMSRTPPRRKKGNGAKRTLVPEREEEPEELDPVARELALRRMEQRSFSNPGNTDLEKVVRRSHEFSAVLA
jgi:hypothetical protein